MPLEWIDKTNDDWACAIWHINEPLSFFIDSADFESCCKGYLQISHPSKQLQWLASRWLSKEILLRKWNLPFDGIVSNSLGKPSLKGYDFYISLSNSHDKATAIIHRKSEVGIDIELIKPKIALIAQKFLKPSEIHFLGNDLIKLTVAWCCKESLYKIHGQKAISLKEHINLKAFDLDDYTTISAELCTQIPALTYYLKHRQVNQYMMVYSVDKTSR